MSYPRIRPYKTWALDDADAGVHVQAHELVLERPVGIDLEVNLAPHPNFRGQITFSTFRGSSLLVEAGGANVVYLFVEDWPRGDRRRKNVRAFRRPALGHLYTVDAKGQKTATPHRKFKIELAEDATIEIDFTPPAPWARHVCIETPNWPLAVSFCAANVLGIWVDQGQRGSKRHR